ncbi:MAG: PilZ domain-containing protein, partial [Candidatus Krumholzibacteriota bacterium]|nr:PilZ domain-containing protein [Candidatus Krumholzibacteriota bacterium]
QSLFYSLIEPGRDRWNAAYFVGSCAVLRRKALDDIDGFQTGSITEDMLTSIRIHARGWRSAYHSEKLAYGIAAETIRPFLIQRSRWGHGGWQVFFKANPLFLPGLSFAQRLCYFESLIYPLEGFQKLVFYLTPPIALVTGVLPMRALDIAYLVHFIPYYALSLFAFNEMCRGYGGILLLEQFSMGKFVAYMKTLGMVLLPRRASFQVTPKGRHAPMAWGLVAVQAFVGLVSIAAIVFALAQLLLGRRGDDFIVAVNSLWALYNSGLAIGIILYARKKFVQRREDFRISDAVPVVCGYSDGERIVRRLAVADDLTGRGASVILTGARPPTGEMRLEFVVPGGRIAARGRIVHQRSVRVNGYHATRAGLHFTGIETVVRDEMTRYLHEFSVDKFMAEYEDRYRTWLERRHDREHRRVRRARRHEGLVPVVVRNGHESLSYGVIRNISKTGALITTWEELPPGDRVNLYAGIGGELVPIPGEVVRMRRHVIGSYPEYRTGIRFSQPGSFKVGYTAWYARKSGTLR